MNAAGLDIKIINNLEELERYAGPWNELAYQAPHPLPDSSYAWTASYLEYQLKEAESWFCLMAFDRSNLIGVLPLIMNPGSRWGLNCLSFRSPYDDQTASVDFLIESRREKEVIPLFLRKLNQMKPDIFCIEMRHLPEDSPTLGVVKEGCKAFSPVAIFDGYGSFLRVDGSFASFQERLGAKFVRNLRRIERKMLKLPGTRVTFSSGEALSDRELSLFMQVEASSWKCSKGSALFQWDSLVSFYRALTRRLGNLGWLEWHFVEAEGKTIAANLAIRINRSLVVLKTCYDEAYAAYSPGTFLFAKVFERAFHSSQVDEVNLLTDYSWNKNWQVAKRSYYNVYLYPHKPFPIVAGLLPLKMRLGLRKVPGTRRTSQFCVQCLEGLHLRKVMR